MARGAAVHEGARPHVLGVDDAPFEKRQQAPVPIVAVMMEGADLVESVAVSSFAVDGDDATGFLAGWLGGLRSLASVQAVLLGGITLAGLGVVDVAQLARRLDTPVLVATRREPSDAQLAQALSAAGLQRTRPDRRALAASDARGRRALRGPGRHDGRRGGAPGAGDAAQGEPSGAPARGAPRRARPGAGGVARARLARPRGCFERSQTSVAPQPPRSAGASTKRST